MAEGFFFDELSDFKKELMLEAKELFPEETKKFIKKEGRALSKKAKNIAKQIIGTAKGIKKDWKYKTSYHAGFDSSKVFFSNGDICCKAFNHAPHAKLIEYGHYQVPRGKKGASNKGGKPNGFTEGKYVFEKASTEYGQEFSKNCDEFLGQYFDDIGDHK